MDHLTSKLKLQHLALSSIVETACHSAIYSTGYQNSVISLFSKRRLCFRLTVAKEGANKGRQFYACAKPRGQGCNYFVWADENPAGQNGKLCT